MTLKILCLSKWQKMLQLGNDFPACGIEKSLGLEKSQVVIVQAFVETSGRPEDPKSSQTQRALSRDQGCASYNSSNIRTFPSLSCPLTSLPWLKEGLSQKEW